MDSKRWVVAVAMCASSVLASTRARAASDEGGNQVPPEQGQPVQANVIVQPPGSQPPTIVQPTRRFLWFQLRGGPAIPLVGSIASGGGFGGFGSALIGVQSQTGASGGLVVGGRYFANSLTTLGYASIGGVLRYTFLRDVVIHPFGEAGVDLLYGLGLGNGMPFGRTYPQIAFSLTGAVGVEYDITERISIELAARATLFGGDGGADFALEPWLGLTYYR